jgi:hypothetical protein
MTDDSDARQKPGIRISVLRFAFALRLMRNA